MYLQILDMRWGIASDVSNTHMATSICLNETEICQNTSSGPNFIVTKTDCLYLSLIVFL